MLEEPVCACQHPGTLTRVQEAARGTRVGVGSPVQLALRISAGPNWPNVAGMRDWLAVAGRSPHGIEGWAVCDRQLTHRVKTVALI
jgi:hypothetical protein